MPKKGTTIFKAGESLKADSPGSLDFTLLEGESDDLQCDFEMLDSGNIVFE